MRVNPFLLRCMAISTALASFSVAQKPATPTKPADADYTAKREVALAPVLLDMRTGDYSAAHTALTPVLANYAHDVRVLYLAGEIARGTGNFSEALSFFQQSLAQNPNHAGALRLGQLWTYADMGRWADFNQERAAIRELSLNGDPSLPIDRGYIIEDHRAGDVRIVVLEFPSMDSTATTHFRFMFVSKRTPASKFIPSIDLETNAADAASFAQEYPQKAAAHVQMFALVSYPDAHTRGFLKFYADGEPPYEDLRADVLSFAAKMTEPSGPTQHFRPAYHTP
jgi:hypothetical protein